MLIDIVFLPAKPVRASLGRVAQNLSQKFPLVFAVDNKKLFSHLSLYHLNLPKRRLKALLLELAEFSRKQPRLSLRIIGPAAGRHYFSFATNKPKQLLAAHARVVKTFSGYRTVPVTWPTPIKTRAQKEYVKKYGVPNVLKNFSPHFTLGWAKRAGDVAAITANLKKRKFPSFKIKSVAVAKIDKFGQVYKILKTFKLK